MDASVARRLAIQREAREDLKRSLEEEFGTAGLPNASTLFDLAWSYGHSAGDHEVRNYYLDMYCLIK